MNYDISAIIINYNSFEYTKNCILSIIDKTDENLLYQIIIVDNASENDDYKSLKLFVENLKNDHVRLHGSRINTGFGGGNMAGVQFAKGKYYAFINNDTILTNDCLKLCFEFMEKNQNIGVCGPQLYNEKGEKIPGFDHFTSFGREIFGKRALEILFPNSKPRRSKIYNNPLKVDYICGSFMFFNALDFDNVGGFDTNLFLYFEESDICYRLKKNKKDSYFLPEPGYVHYHGKSTKMNINIKLELKTSMFYVIKKHYGYFYYQVLRFIFIIRYTFASLIKPVYFLLLYRLIIGLPLSKSLKQKQKIIKR